jgi:hypothetical protein
MWRLTLAIGGIGLLAASFFGTLFLLDSASFQSFDAQRTAHAKSLKSAIEKYRSVHGKYPAPFPGNDVAELKNELVGGGFISKIPVDPYWKDGRINKYRYRSDGNSYSLLLHFELGPCQTGVGPITKNTWDGHNVLQCPF